MNTPDPPIKIHLRHEESNGEVALTENLVPAGFAGPPLHHHDFDELFYVLEGELTFRLEDEVFTRPAGEQAFAPRGVPHTYANRSGEEARVLIVITPAGFERYFGRLSAKVAGTDPPEWALGPVPETIVVGGRIGEDGGPR